MGWFDRFFKNKKQVSLQDKFEMKLILRDEFYILKELDIKFKRELARNGYPDNDGCSGFIPVLYMEQIGKQLQAWPSMPISVKMVRFVCTMLRETMNVYFHSVFWMQIVFTCIQRHYVL